MIAASNFDGMTTPHDTSTSPGVAQRDADETRVERRSSAPPPRAVTHVDALDETPLATRSSGLDGAASPGAAPPATIGRYLVLGQLGAGAMGVVHTAYDPELDRKVAIKLLRGRASPEASARLVREAQAMAKLSHPNVVPVYDVGESEGAVFVAMDLVEGTDLRAWLRAQPRAWREVVDVFIDAGRGLAAAHAVGLIHRDFKPDNVLIGQVPGSGARRVQVADFGLAKLGEERLAARVDDESLGTSTLEATLTVNAELIGTPAYMAPEQFLTRHADTRSDQFAYCVALWEALYGERPFSGATVQRLRANVMQNRRREPASRRAAPRWLQRVCNRGLAMNPDERYPSMDALLAELERRRRARPWLTVALAGTTLTALGLAALRSPPSTEARDCVAEARERVGLWSDDARASIREAFSASERAYADDSLRALESRLDRYVSDWRLMYAEACEATRVRDTQSERALELRASCLEENRRQLSAQLELFKAADADVVRRAVDIVERLPSVERCAELTRLRAARARPEDPEQRAQLDALELELSRARALLGARKHARALELLTPLRERAAELDFAPLVLDIRLELARAQYGSGDKQRGRETLERALWDALEESHDAPLFEAMKDLSFQVGYDALKPEQGRLWIRHAEALLERELRAGATLTPAREASRRAALAHNRGLIELSAGNLEDARALLEEALQLNAAATPEDPDNASMIGGLASVHLRGGRYEDASQLFETAVATVERAKGLHHPDLLGPLNNLALALERQARYSEAVDALDRGLQIFADTVGEAHPNYGLVLANRGYMVFLAGRADEGEDDMERALTIMERALGREHGQLASSLALLGELKLRRGKHEQARARFERARALRVTALGEDSSTLALPLAGLGRVELAEGRPESALPLLERARALAEKAEQDPADLGLINAALARALWQTSAHARARELAAAALAHLEEAGVNSRAERAELERWIAARPPAP